MLGNDIQSKFLFFDHTIVLLRSHDIHSAPRIRDSPYEKKKGVAVHFTTIPCESNKDNRHIESHGFAKFVPVPNQRLL